jgi:hypothetical protein
MADIKQIITELPSGLPAGTTAVVDGTTNEIIQITSNTE